MRNAEAHSDIQKSQTQNDVRLVERLGGACPMNCGAAGQRDQFVAAVSHELSVDGRHDRTRPVRATTIRRVSAAAWLVGTSLRTIDSVRLGTPALVP